MSAGIVIDDAIEVAHWRERAELAESRLVGAEARIGELVEQVAVLSRMLFGRSSEKSSSGGSGDRVGDDGPADPSGDQAGSGRGGPARARGQQRGSKGHGRRDYSGLETREEVHDVPDGQRVCAGCGQPLEFLGSESSEQIDWQVRITRTQRLQKHVGAKNVAADKRLRIVQRVINVRLGRKVDDHVRVRHQAINQATVADVTMDELDLIYDWAQGQLDHRHR